MIKQITRKEVNKRIQELAEQYEMLIDGNSLVLGVATGGIVPGYLLALRLGCNYQNIRPNKPIPKNILENKKPIIVVDDIEDTGTTKKKIMEQFKGRTNVSFETVVKANGVDWFVFYWETDQDGVNELQTSNL